MKKAPVTVAFNRSDASLHSLVTSNVDSTNPSRADDYFSSNYSKKQTWPRNLIFFFVDLTTYSMRSRLKLSLKFRHFQWRNYSVLFKLFISLCVAINSALKIKYFAQKHLSVWKVRRPENSFATCTHSASLDCVCCSSLHQRCSS